MNKKESLQFLDKCIDSVKNANNDDIERYRKVYINYFKNKNNRKIARNRDKINNLINENKILKKKGIENND